jgi:hypothetical protein
MSHFDASHNLVSGSQATARTTPTPFQPLRTDMEQRSCRCNLSTCNAYLPQNYTSQVAIPSYSTCNFVSCTLLPPIGTLHIARRGVSRHAKHAETPKAALLLCSIWHIAGQVEILCQDTMTPPTPKNHTNPRVV